MQLPLPSAELPAPASAVSVPPSLEPAGKGNGAQQHRDIILQIRWYWGEHTHQIHCTSLRKKGGVQIVQIVEAFKIVQTVQIVEAFKIVSEARRLQKA